MPITTEDMTERAAAAEEQPGPATTLPPRGASVVEFEKYWAGTKYEEIIDWNVNYVVFFDHRWEVDWDTSPKYDEEIAKKPEALAAQNAVMTEAAILEAKDCEAFGKATTDWFRYLVGKALAFAFDGDYAGAQRILQAAGQYFRDRSHELSRRWYVEASLLWTGPFVLLGAWLWTWRSSLSNVFGETVFWVLLSLMAGALGALLSVLARSGKLEFDSSAGIRLHYIEALSRIITGALSGAVIGLAVKSKILLGPVVQGDSSHAILILAALAAGSSERMLGSIISKFDTSPPPDATGPTEEKPAPNAPAANGTSPDGKPKSKSPDDNKPSQ